MTFNHGVRSSNLRWSTTKEHPLWGVFLLLKWRFEQGVMRSFRNSPVESFGPRVRAVMRQHGGRISDGAPTKNIPLGVFFVVLRRFENEGARSAEEKGSGGAFFAEVCVPTCGSMAGESPMEHQQKAPNSGAFVFMPDLYF